MSPKKNLTNISIDYDNEDKIKKCLLP